MANLKDELRGFYDLDNWTETRVVPLDSGGWYWELKQGDKVLAAGTELSRVKAQAEASMARRIFMAAEGQRTGNGEGGAK